MPDLDVSEVLFDPDFADVFTVQRRAEAVNTSGRSQVTVTPFIDIVGVITSTDPSDLERRDDGQMMTRTINVVTAFRLRGPSPGFQPDQIVHDGVTYTVDKILPFTRFGRGFIEAVATSMNAQTPAAE